MTVLVDTSVLIDYLRGRPQASALLEAEGAVAALHASEITRLEVLAGMRAHEQDATRALLASLRWHPVDEVVAERRGRWAGRGCRPTSQSTPPTSRSLPRRS